MPSHVPLRNQPIVTCAGESPGPPGTGVPGGFGVTVTKSCTVAPVATARTGWWFALWIVVAVCDASWTTADCELGVFVIGSVGQFAGVGRLSHRSFTG